MVLLRRFEIEKHHGMKLEPQWEGPYRLVQMAYHGRSGRLQDLQTGDIVRVKKGGLRERVHVNDLKLFCPRHLNELGGSLPSNLVDLEVDDRELEWEVGKRRYYLGGP